jgi:hypothetical protein
MNLFVKNSGSLLVYSIPGAVQFVDRWRKGWAMSKPTIYVFAPDLSHPLGGMRMLYRHVDILNANGFEAYIVHASKNFRIGWFEHSTPVLHGPVRMKEEDIAV